MADGALLEKQMHFILCSKFLKHYLFIDLVCIRPKLLRTYHLNPIDAETVVKIPVIPVEPAKQHRDGPINNYNKNIFK